MVTITLTDLIEIIEEIKQECIEENKDIDLQEINIDISGKLVQLSKYGCNYVIIGRI